MKMKFLLLIFPLFLKYLAKEKYLIFLMGNCMYDKFVYIEVENVENIAFVRSSCVVAYFMYEKQMSVTKNLH